MSEEVYQNWVMAKLYSFYFVHSLNFHCKMQNKVIYIQYISKYDTYQVLVTKLCLTLCDCVDCSPPGSSVHGILQARYWSGLLLPSPGDLPDLEIEPRSSTLQANSLLSEPPGKPYMMHICI